MELDLDKAYAAYVARFEERFGDKPDGAFVKFGKHMVQKLRKEELDTRLRHYLRMHGQAKQMLTAGSTINDAVVLEFDEAAAWLAIQAPDMLQMFSGEVGDPSVATGESLPPSPKAQ